MTNDTMTTASLVPRLVVPDPDAAAAFYRTALGADVRGRFTLPDGTVTNIDVAIGQASFSLTSQAPGWGLLGPEAVGGSPVLLRLTVPDARRARDAMVQAGGVEVVAVEDRPYGRCEGRVRDPFGHLWILGHVTERLTDDKIPRARKRCPSASTSPSTAAAPRHTPSTAPARSGHHHRTRAGMLGACSPTSRRPRPHRSPSATCACRRARSSSDAIRSACVSGSAPPRRACTSRSSPSATAGSRAGSCCSRSRPARRGASRGTA
jgi:PhnB protein